MAFILYQKFLKKRVTRKFYLYFNNTKIPELKNSEVLVSLKVPSYVPPDFFLIGVIILVFPPLSMTWKFPFWVFKKCSLAHFEYKESFGQIWVKITESSLSWKFLFRIFKRCSFSSVAFVLAYFEYKESLGKNYRIIYLTWKVSI